MNRAIEKSLDKLGSEFNNILDKLSRIACPACGAYTLEAELIVRTGARFNCRGWKLGAEDHNCDFERVVTVTSPSELPEIDQKDKVQT